MIISLVWFVISLVMLWVGAGLAVNAIVRISHSLHIRSFFVSFFLLGFCTSISEIMLGVNAAIQNQPEIFVGNLIGGSVVIFLLIIPLLAMAGGGVNLNHSFTFKDLVTAVAVIGMPALLTLDNNISITDALICLASYGYFVFSLQRGSKTFEQLATIDFSRKFLLLNIFKVAVAVVIVFAASNLLVHHTVLLGNYFGISTFILSILVLSIGTNIPELSIAVRAITEQKNDIAFGDYVGSASLNTAEMGILILAGGKTIPANGSNFSVLAFLIGLVVFAIFGKSKSSISRREGLGLLVWYVLFIGFELATGPGWKF